MMREVGMSASALRESQLLWSFKSSNGVDLVRHTMAVWFAAVEIISEQKGASDERKNDAGPSLISPNSDTTTATQSHEDIDHHATEPAVDMHYY